MSVAHDNVTQGKNSPAPAAPLPAELTKYNAHIRYVASVPYLWDVRACAVTLFTNNPHLPNIALLCLQMPNKSGMCRESGGGKLSHCNDEISSLASLVIIIIYVLKVTETLHFMYWLLICLVSSTVFLHPPWCCGCWIWKVMLYYILQPRACLHNRGPGSPLPSLQHKLDK